MTPKLGQKSLVFEGAGHVAWQDTAEPELADAASALVRPLAVARCDLDLPMAAGGLFPGPFVVGHEIAAEVVAVGAEVTAHRPGQVVIVPFQVSCGSCVRCRRRTFAACDTHRAPIGASFGFGSSGGGFGGGVADLLAVPAADHMLVPAPPALSPVVLAGLSDNVADGYRAVAGPLHADPGADVLIVAGGLASVPLYAVAVARALGSSTVRYVDRDPERVAAAVALGAHGEVHDGPWPKRFDPAPVTVDATGDPAGLACVLRSTEPYGTCTSVAVYFEPVELRLVELYTRGVTFHTSRVDGRRLLDEVLDLVASGRLDPLAVPTTVMSWEDAGEVWLTPATKLIVARDGADHLR